MKTYFVVNPSSGNGGTGRRWPELQAKIARLIPEFDHAFTQRPMHAVELTRAAIGNGFECVVAVGGDGTINEVTNGFFRDGKAINPQAALGIIPRGTGGDFRRTFGWDTDFDQALRRIASGQSKPFDVGMIEFHGHDGKTQRRYFANICSFGASGVVDQEANRTTKAFGGKLSFMFASTKAMLKYKDRKVRFSVDGGAGEDVMVTTLAVANGKYFGGGMKVAPQAEVSDGVFDVTIWSGYKLMDFALKQGSLYNGTHTRWSGTRQLKCKTITAESAEEVLIDCDGEQPGKLPCTMTILPAAIWLRG
jgi:YegS/Rv2252/BmrU family lipid kinase